MSRVIHFEIHADDVKRACDFYQAVFAWAYEDWSEFAGMPYFGVTTGDDDQPGINGAIMARAEAGGGPGAPVNGAVLTMGTDDYDTTEGKILEAGGQVAIGRCVQLEEPGTRCPAWRGRATTSTPRAMSSASTSPTPRPADRCASRPIRSRSGSRQPGLAVRTCV